MKSVAFLLTFDLVHAASFLFSVGLLPECTALCLQTHPAASFRGVCVLYVCACLCGMELDCLSIYSMFCSLIIITFI